MPQVADRGVAVEDLQHEQRQRAGGVEDALTPDVPRARAKQSLTNAAPPGQPRASDLIADSAAAILAIRGLL